VAREDDGTPLIHAQSEHCPRLHLHVQHSPDGCDGGHSGISTGRSTTFGIFISAILESFEHFEEPEAISQDNF
jgi:hypothetical protein